jgi:glycosyltransferase involved in cell wall biosynthesis
MHVLYLHQYFKTPAGSGGIRSYQMARHLIKRGHSVTIVCGSSDRGGVGLDTPFRRGVRRGIVDGIQVIEFDLAYSNYDGFLKRTWTFLRFALRSIALALTLPYDLVFATSTPLTAGIPGIVARWLRRKPFVFEVRDLWPELPRAMGVITNPIVLRLMDWLEWVSYHAATACIGLSPGIVQGIQRRGIAPDRVTMVPNGSDLDIFFPSQASVPPLPGIAPDDLLAAFTGAHGRANGLDAVLHAAAELKRRQRHDIKLLFIGDGALKPALRARAASEGLDNCLFLDPVSKHDLSLLMSRVDVGLMILANVPAFYYGTSPNKFFDYIAAGLPVLNNYPGWLADLITENHCGLAIPPDDPTAFADALVYLADHPLERTHMGTNARALAEQEFGREHLAEKFVNWLEIAQEPHP